MRAGVTPASAATAAMLILRPLFLTRNIANCSSSIVFSRLRGRVALAAGAGARGSVIFDALTRPFYGAFRRFVPPIGGIDLSPLFVLVLAQVLLILLGGLTGMAQRPI